MFLFFAPSPCFLPCLRAFTCGYSGTSRTISPSTCFLIIFHGNIVSSLGTFSFDRQLVSDDRVIRGCLYVILGLGESSLVPMGSHRFPFFISLVP